MTPTTDAAQRPAFPEASAPKRTAYLAWIAVCVLWGTTYLGIRIALETIPPALVGGLRYTAAGLFLSSILAARGQGLPPRPQWRGLAVIGLLTICIGNGGVIWAEQWVPSGIAAVTVATVPFWMIGVEAFTRDADPLSTRLVVGLLVGFGGILLLVWPDIAADNAAGHQFLVGVIALQIACVGWAIGSALSRRHARHENVLSAAAMQMTFGGLFMLAAATARGEWTHLAFNARTMAAEIYLTVVGSIVGYSAYIYALRHLADGNGVALRVRQPRDCDGAGCAGSERAVRPARHRRVADGAGGIGAGAVAGNWLTARGSRLARAQGSRGSRLFLKP